jgi:hypothetical protein
MIMQLFITPLLIITLAIATPTTHAAAQQRVSAQTFIEALRADESQEELNALLAQGVDAQSEHDATTALIEAVKTNHYAALALLTSPHHKLDINACDQDGNTALHHAVKSRSTNLVNALLATKKINPNVRNNREITPIMIAAQQADLETVIALFMAGAELDARDNMGKSVLEHALLGTNQDAAPFATRKAKIKRFSTVSFIYYRSLSVTSAERELISTHPVYAALLATRRLNMAEQAIRQGKKLAGQAWQAATSEQVRTTLRQTATWSQTKSAEMLAGLQARWNTLPSVQGFYQDLFATQPADNAAAPAAQNDAQPQASVEAVAVTENNDVQ